jgi:hypothetical protein
MAGLRSGLSRMKGNFHVRFLGEGVTAMSLPYPTNIPSGFHGRPNGHPYCLNAADLLGMTTGDAGDWRMGAWAAFGKKTCQIRRTDVKRPESK